MNSILEILDDGIRNLKEHNLTPEILWCNWHIYLLILEDLKKKTDVLDVKLATTYKDVAIGVNPLLKEMLIIFSSENIGFAVFEGNKWKVYIEGEDYE